MSEQATIPPPGDRRWYKTYEFHHPNYSRPYYGCFVRKTEHEAIEHGLLECPPCTDYTEIVRAKVLVEWGLK
ncbi:MAG: hypothetical protein WC718_18165 [Phycisphaerales bacterium]|jgi:hypothetical protein